MIRINLLPDDQRAATRTPVKLVATLAIVAALNAGLGTWWAFEAFSEQVAADQAVASRELELEGLRPQTDHLKALDSEMREHKAREEALASIAANRIGWTRKLDEFVDVVNKGGDGQRHLVWFDDMQVVRTSDPRAKTAGELRAAGHSGSEKFAQVANFLDDVSASGFAGGFLPPADPEGSQSMEDKELVPSNVWSFPLSMKIQAPEERGSGAKKGAANQKSADAAPAKETK